MTFQNAGPGNRALCSCIAAPMFQCLFMLSQQIYLLEWCFCEQLKTVSTALAFFRLLEFSL